ncbi:hypothetical protein BJ508DRAFT_323506 [Ascobolus immersus RN42]|uniref:Uncharacterized protein n=1 Tax=Ascobolus immersus RN42 TaxID=1160509 RepID=A0A3N4IIQ9_ASCIM|nr:hypothetical protein BJ508DRAFT_323506 [Ascobolus immersus RN42]
MAAGIEVTVDPPRVSPEQKSEDLKQACEEIKHDLDSAVEDCSRKAEGEIDTCRKKEWLSAENEANTTISIFQQWYTPVKESADAICNLGGDCIEQVLLEKVEALREVAEKAATWKEHDTPQLLLALVYEGKGLIETISHQYSPIHFRKILEKWQEKKEMEEKSQKKRLPSFLGWMKGTGGKPTG